MIGGDDGLDMNELTIYTSEDCKSRIRRGAGHQAVCPTAAKMAGLFDVTSHNISLCLEIIFRCRDEPECTTEEPAVAQWESGGATPSWPSRTKSKDA